MASCNAAPTRCYACWRMWYGRNNHVSHCRWRSAPSDLNCQLILVHILEKSWFFSYFACRNCFKICWPHCFLVFLQPATRTRVGMMTAFQPNLFQPLLLYDAIHSQKGSRDRHIRHSLSQQLRYRHHLFGISRYNNGLLGKNFLVWATEQLVKTGA